MAATIEVRGETATLDATLERGWFWRSTSKFLQDFLNAQLPEGGPSGADPTPTFHEALRMARLLSGTVVRRDPVVHVPGRVY